MKTAIAVIVMLTGLTDAASAQSLYGVTLGNLQAIRDANENVSTITGSLANLSAHTADNVMLTFVLYDEQGREIGRVRDDSAGPLAPGQIKMIRAITPLPFAKVSAQDILARRSDSVKVSVRQRQQEHRFGIGRTLEQAEIRGRAPSVIPPGPAIHRGAIS